MAANDCDSLTSLTGSLTKYVCARLNENVLEFAVRYQR